MRLRHRRVRKKDRARGWLVAILPAGLAAFCLAFALGQTPGNSLAIGGVAAFLGSIVGLRVVEQQWERLAALRAARAARRAAWPPAPHVGRPCPHCGASAEDSKRFCPSCGARLTVAAPIVVGATAMQSGCAVLLAIGLGLVTTCTAGPFVLGFLANAYQTSLLAFAGLLVVIVVAALTTRDLVQKSKFKGFACEEYLTPAYRHGLRDEPGRQWLIVPPSRAYRHDNFLAINTRRADGIGWGYLRGEPGLWMYEPTTRKFRYLAPSLAEMVNNWKARR